MRGADVLDEEVLVAVAGAAAVALEGAAVVVHGAHVLLHVGVGLEAGVAARADELLWGGGGGVVGRGGGRCGGVGGDICGMWLLLDVGGADEFLLKPGDGS